MDWSKVITDLEAAGLTQQEIATACQCSQPYISQLKAGVRSGVSFQVGNALSELHASRVRPDGAKPAAGETRTGTS